MAMKKFYSRLYILNLIGLLIIFSGCQYYTSEKKLEILKKAQSLVGEKADWHEVIKTYEELTKFEKVNSKDRQKALRYVLDRGLELLQEGKGEEAIELGLALDKLIPNDFYVQNRIIGGYRVIAEKQAKEGKFEEALKTFNKGLSIRFDQQIMQSRLKIMLDWAEDEIKKKNIEKVKSLINEVLMIVNIEENKTLFPDEKKRAEELVKLVKKVGK